MDTTELRRRYEEILDFAERHRFAPVADGWSAHMLLAHLALNDKLLVEGLRSGRYDTTEAVNEEWLRTELDPLSTLRESSAEVLEALAVESEEGTGRKIEVHLADEGAGTVDHVLTVAQLAQVHTDVHLASHFDQLQELAL